MLVILDKLNFYLHKFWTFLKPRRKLGLVSFVILASFILVVWVVGTDVAHAASGLWGDILNGIINMIMAVAGWFIKLTFFILKFVIEVAGYNGFIDSDAVIVGWIMVRDVTNMFFVVVLLLISFGTILGLEQYEYKKLLVKLLMAAIIVNFSRIICGIIIDVAQVVMITFVNGIAATAAGNMTQMFGMDEIFSFSKNENLTDQNFSSDGEMFLAAVASITFAAIMMMTMLTFLFLLMARMMTLWVLIVLSPFAFVLNVLPQTQKFAGQWWTDFGGNVVAGPIIAFFLWLSFVTVGAGNAHDRMAEGNAHPLEGPSDTSAETSTGLTKVMTWAKMANFAIAIGMLLTGAKIAQQLGAAGGSMMGKAGEFGKKVAMIASGATAARWAGKKAWNVAKKKAPIIGTESLDRKWRSIKAVGGRIKKKMPIVGDIARTKGAKWLGRSGAKAWKKGSEMANKEGATGWERFKGRALQFGGGAVGITAGKVAEGVIETTARSEKRTKKREAMNEALAKEEDNEMGFSDTGLGKALTAQEGKNKVRGDEKDLQKERGALLAQANAHRANGNIDRAEALEAAAGELGYNKAKEAMKGLTGNELVAQIGRLTKDILKAREAGDSKKEQELMGKFYAARTMAIGHEEDWVAKSADEEIIKIAGIDRTGGGGEGAEQRLSLSLDLVGNVGLGGEGAAAKMVTKVLDGKGGESRAFVRARRKAEKHAEVKGSLDRAGMTQERVNTETGKVDYIISGDDFGEVATGKKDPEGKDIMRPKTYAEAAKGEISAIKKYIHLNANGYAPVKNTHRDSTERIVEMDSDESGLIIEKLQGQTANYISNLEGVIDDLNRMVDKDGKVAENAQKEATRIYSKLSTKMGDGAYKDFRSRTEKLANAVKAAASSTKKDKPEKGKGSASAPAPRLPSGTREIELS